MNEKHPTDEQLDRYRRRVAPPAELLEVDAHVGSCDRCYAAVRADLDGIALPAGHLRYDELEAYADGTIDADDREIVDSHIAHCELCRNELADLRAVAAGVETAGSSGVSRWWLAAAAILVLVILAAWLVLARRQDPPSVTPPVVRKPQPQQTPPVVPPQRIPETQVALALQRPAILDTLIRGEGVLRGTGEQGFALREPVGTVVLDDRPRLSWNAAAGATSYEVAIADVETGSVAATASTGQTFLRVQTPLRRGRTYMWQVTARLAGGTTRAAPGPSAPEALFHVASPVDALPDDPVQRGIALANVGALDDAERALEAAAKRDPRAAELLAQVRSWRQR